MDMACDYRIFMKYKRSTASTKIIISIVRYIMIFTNHGNSSVSFDLSWVIDVFRSSQVMDNNAIPVKKSMIDINRLATYPFPVLWTSTEVILVNSIENSNANIEYEAMIGLTIVSGPWLMAVIAVIEPAAPVNPARIR